ncbi:unnamed protein product [Caenorhabditis sp. 36 PRJEB53466]|nr:unnamed protein product [Caenorhabditis sp. 36 PRJEB53466]
MIRLGIIVFLIIPVETAFRYENRTLACTASNGIDECFLTAPDTKLRNLDLNIKCKREPTDDGKKQRLACPIRCPRDYEVLNKIPSSNRRCTKYFTYGKYPGVQEWHIWMLEPCISTISTHCRYPEEVVDFVV